MFEIYYYKPKNKSFLDNLEKTVDKVQNYVPIYQSFFDLNETNYNNISFNHKYHIIDFDKVYEMGDLESNTINRNIFIKYSPVLDPVKYMIGKYNLSDPRIRALPKYNSSDEECLPKTLDVNNSSYIDGFFTYLTSQLLHNHGVFHGVDYYGSFMGVQNEFKMNVAEDLDYLEESDFFNRNLGKLFKIDNPYDSGEFMTPNDNSRKLKQKIQLSEESVSDEKTNEIVDIEIENLTDIDTVPAENDTDIELVDLTDIGISNNESENNDQNSFKNLKNISFSSHSSSNSSSSSLNYTTDEDAPINDDDDSEGNSKYGSDIGSEMDTDDCDDDDESSSSECSEDIEIMGTIYNFPVHMICLEKCDGTMDELMAADKLNEKEWRSALFQVIMTLLIYQKAFHLTHNDLHTNNIMYVHTKEKYIYYLFNKKYYKVPTYGKIYKIIDYGRAIYKYRGKLFCSDSFDFAGDAATQYNFPPYYNDKKPVIEPNYSFDLCRLGCSMYDCLIGDYEEEDVKNFNEIQKLVMEWCTDDNGKNVLYKKNGEERYPSFKLYRMIARIVHSHTPIMQLKRPIFKNFECGRGMGEVAAASISKLFINIDEIPCYV